MVARIALLLVAAVFLALLAGSAAPARASRAPGGVALVEWASSEAARDGTPLLRQSELAMRAVHFQHAEGQIATVYKGKHANLRITADCDTTAAPRDPKIRAAESMRARSWARGTALSSIGRVQTVDPHFVELGYADRARVWERSAGTHNVWKAKHWTDATDFQSFIPDACAIGFVSAPRAPPPGAPPPGRVAGAFQNLGTQTLQGRPVWHLQLKGPAGSMITAADLSIDMSTHLWLRKGQIYGDSTVETINFSRYGRPISIAIPKVGSAGADVPGVKEETEKEFVTTLAEGLGEKHLLVEPAPAAHQR